MTPHRYVEVITVKRQKHVGVPWVRRYGLCPPWWLKVRYVAAYRSDYPILFHFPTESSKDSHSALNILQLLPKFPTLAKCEMRTYIEKSAVVIKSNKSFASAVIVWRIHFHFPKKKKYNIYTENERKIKEFYALNCAFFSI